VNTSQKYYPYHNFETAKVVESLEHLNPFWYAFIDAAPCGLDGYPNQDAPDDIWDRMLVILTKYGITTTIYGDVALNNPAINTKMLNKVFSLWRQWGCP